MRRTAIKRKTPLRSKSPSWIKKIATSKKRKTTVRVVPKFLCDDGVYRYPDGREECETKSKKGREEYARRTRDMWERQHHMCRLQISDQCKAKRGRLLITEAEFDHEDGRGMGGSHRDDRIEVNGKPQNGAVCHWCNTLKGSRRIPYLDSVD